MSITEAKSSALGKHPDCEYAEAYNGISWNFQMTWVVKLWRTQECYLAGDPPRHTVEGFEASQ